MRRNLRRSNLWSFSSNIRYCRGRLASDHKSLGQISENQSKLKMLSIFGDWRQIDKVQFWKQLLSIVAPLYNIKRGSFLHKEAVAYSSVWCVAFYYFSLELFLRLLAKARPHSFQTFNQKPFRSANISFPSSLEKKKFAFSASLEFNFFFLMLHRIQFRTRNFRFWSKENKKCQVVSHGNFLRLLTQVLSHFILKLCLWKTFMFQIGPF